MKTWYLENLLLQIQALGKNIFFSLFQLIYSKLFKPFFKLLDLHNYLAVYPFFTSLILTYSVAVSKSTDLRCCGTLAFIPNAKHFEWSNTTFLFSILLLHTQHILYTYDRNILLLLFIVERITISEFYVPKKLSNDIRLVISILLHT